MGIAALCLLSTSSALANLVIISIGTIEPNVRISGFVSGLSGDAKRDYKVLVYVHTDQWRIHPDAKAAARDSFGTIAADGTWQVKTVRRKPNADRVGAIVVPATFAPPAKIESLADVPHVSITIRNLKGAGDYGKL